VVAPLLAVLAAVVLLTTVVRARGVGVPAFAAVVGPPVARAASVELTVPLGRLLASGVGVAMVVGLALATNCVACTRLAAGVGVVDAAGVAGVFALPPHAASATMSAIATNEMRRFSRTTRISRTLLTSRQGEASPPPALAP
jgi:hypothetical protein